jgi:hypothetical protein
MVETLMDKHGDMWVDVLRAARDRPPMLGIYRDRPVPRLSNLVFDVPFFADVRGAELYAAPTQFIWKIQCRGIRPRIANLMDWDGDTLLGALGELRTRIRSVPDSWAMPFRTPSDVLSVLISNLFVARSAVLALRHDDGWCIQMYSQGWPIVAPTECVSAFRGVGCIVGASLKGCDFDGVPLSEESVRAGIPESHRRSVEVHWHDTDDLVPEDMVDTSAIERICGVP